MNLYSVSDRNYEWQCFAFDVSANKAKMAVADHFGEDYIDTRCTTLKKGVNMPVPRVVDCETDKGYEMVLQCGFHYLSKEELECSYD